MGANDRVRRCALHDTQSVFGRREKVKGGWRIRDEQTSFESKTEGKQLECLVGKRNTLGRLWLDQRRFAAG